MASPPDARSDAHTQKPILAGRFASPVSPQRGRRNA